MAAPGTLTQVLAVAQDLAAAQGRHAAAVAQQAGAAPPADPPPGPYQAGGPPG